LPFASRNHAEYLSPDGSLSFRVVVGGDGEVLLGFVGYGWQTHTDELSALSGLSEHEAVGRFVRALLEDRAVIAASRFRGAVTDVWVTDRRASKDRYAAPCPSNVTGTIQAEAASGGVRIRTRCPPTAASATCTEQRSRRAFHKTADS